MPMARQISTPPQQDLTVPMYQPFNSVATILAVPKISSKKTQLTHHVHALREREVTPVAAAAGTQWWAGGMHIT